MHTTMLTKALNMFFGEHALKTRSFKVQQGDYNSNEVLANLYVTDEQGRITQMNLDDKVVTVIFKKEGGKATPEYATQRDEENGFAVRFGIPRDVQMRTGDYVLQMLVYDDNSQMHSAVVQFEVIPSAGMTGMGKPFVLQIIQEVETALEEMLYNEELRAIAEAQRRAEFEELKEEMKESGGQAGETLDEGKLIEALEELDIISPAKDEDGGYLTDENGNILMLDEAPECIDDTRISKNAVYSSWKIEERMTEEGQKNAQETAAIKEKVDMFIGEDVGKSARQIANEELTSQLITEDAQDALDSLKEISEWIQQHPESAAQMNAKITELGNKIESNMSAVDSLNEDIAKVDKKIETVPNYVITEANSVIDKIAAAQGNRTFTLAAITDLHYGNDSYTDGVLHATQALKYIDERIKLDAVAVLGDFTDGFAGREGLYANAIGDFRAVNAVLNGLRFGPNLRIHGNHDYYEGNMPEILRYTNAYSDDVAWGSRAGDYFYRDFSNHKLRIICLNMVVNDAGTAGCSDEQAKWFAEKINLSEKDDASDWHILILSHQPVDYVCASGYEYHVGNIIDAYINGTAYTNGDVSCDFAGKNSATLVGNIHGHIHNLLVDRIYVGIPSAAIGQQTEVLRIATPEACCGRSNHYTGVWHDNEVTCEKTKNTAEDTSFIVYCLDLDTHTIKAICYGSGYDRTITYGDTLSWEAGIEEDDGGEEGGGADDDFAGTNWIPIATDESGNVVTNGAMYTDKRWNSAGELVDAIGYFITGFIPVKVGDYVRVRWNDTNGASGYAALRAFDGQKNAYDRHQFINIKNGTDSASLSFRNAVGYKLDDSGVFECVIPETKYTPATMEYIAFTLYGDPANAIVTVNEPID